MAAGLDGSGTGGRKASSGCGFVAGFEDFFVDFLSDAALAFLSFFG
jgi:hypothetical protein